MRTVTFSLLLLLIFVIPWENVIHTPLGTAGRTVGVLLAVSWIATLVVTGGFRRPRLFHVAVLLFVLWNLLSVVWSIDSDSTITRAFTLLQLAGLVFVLWDIIDTRASLNVALQAYVLGAYVSVVALMSNYLALAALGLRQRVTVEGFNPNALGLILVLGIPVAWHLAVSRGNGTWRWFRLANYAYIPLAVFCIILTGSRAALVSTLPGFLYILMSGRFGLYPSVLLFAVLLGSLPFLQSIVPESSFQRITRTGASISEGDVSQPVTGGRLTVWREGMEIFAERPLWGAGSGTFKIAAVESQKMAHNMAVALLAEVGAIGLGLFALMVALALMQGTTQPKSYSRLWLSLLTIWMLCSLTHNNGLKKSGWLFLGLAVVSAHVTPEGARSNPKRTLLRTAEAT